MDALSYCRFYRIDPRMIPIMKRIDPLEWYIFQSGSNVLKTGYYSGTGKLAHRVDLTHIVVNACKKANIKYKAYNDAPRGGVTGNKVEILF